MAASPQHIQLPRLSLGKEARERELEEKEAKGLEKPWTYTHINTELDDKELHHMQQKLRGKQIHPQTTLRKWYKVAPYRFGPIRSFHELSDTERIWLQTNRNFWTRKRFIELLGSKLETDNSQKRRATRHSRQQPTSSERDYFINSFARKVGIMHTTAHGQTTVPGKELNTKLNWVGRRELDTYDRGNRILWCLPDGWIVNTTKRSLMSAQLEHRVNLAPALQACKSIVRKGMKEMRERGAKGSAHSVKRYTKRSRAMKRMSTADAAALDGKVAMIAVPTGGSVKKRRKRACNNSMAVLGLSRRRTRTSQRTMQSVNPDDLPNDSASSSSEDDVSDDEEEEEVVPRVKKQQPKRKRTRKVKEKAVLAIPHQLLALHNRGVQGDAGDSSSGEEEADSDVGCSSSDSN